MDLQKAYDSIQWVFLEQLLRALEFPAPFIKWIMVGLTTVSHQINLNGCLTEPFNGGKGLRQGDPISPFLFVICMEYLRRLMRGLKDDTQFKFHPKCAVLGITHLVFADDLLFFCKGDLKSTTALMDMFERFSKTSGLIANCPKSEIYFSGVKQEVKERILEVSGLQEGLLPFRYLGVPLNGKRLSITQFQPLLEKMIGKVTHWTSRLLSYGGRLQLVNSVLYAIQQYWSRIFLFPKKVMRAIEGICRRFLWSGEAGESMKSPIAWDSLCRSKKEGGLTLIHLPTSNKVAFLKLLWAINNKEDKLWIKWLHTITYKINSWWKEQVIGIL
ncbi:hypothetical protein OROGR_007634 [Orobanche gracilis]